ncbi:MAG: hypothetical protein JOY77_09440, partial [Alphaproteobacteria bacterium]|nr:hypothetical protein [Alphaproteobacteria bacterium]
MKLVHVVCGLSALLLAGCAEVDALTSFTNGWFSGGKKSNIKGQRISILASDESLKPDPELAATKVVLP